MIGAKAATRAESDHMGLCKAGPCIPCLVGVAIGLIDPTNACRGGTAADGHDLPMMEFNHCKSGNLRRGHLFGFAICTWHHHGTQQLHILGMTASEASEISKIYGKVMRSRVTVRANLSPSPPKPGADR